MNPRKLNVVVMALLAMATFVLIAQPAQAEPENPIVRGNLSVSVIGGGKVTGTGIDCGSDCTHSESWRDNEMPPTNRLTATPNHGWALLNWSGCTPVSGGRCDAGYGTEDVREVIARFIDVMAPSIFISSISPADVIGDSVHLEVNTTDNDRVTKVEYLIDGAVVATVNSAPWNAELNTASVPEGVHQFQARAYDPAGNNGITASTQLTVDHTGPDLVLNSPLTATNGATASFSFASSSGDFHAAGCAVQKEFADFEPVPCNRDEWFTGDLPTEGNWQFVVVAQDHVGNFESLSHDFVVDRTAPTAAFTAGPADGATVKPGEVTFAWNYDDALAVDQSCSWDSGAVEACDGTAKRNLADGSHRLEVVITDRAGNSTKLTRAFIVRKGAGPGPGPDPDPDQIDRTAPVIKMVAPKQRVKTLRKALRLRVRCNEACSGRVVVRGKGVKFVGRVSLVQAGVAKLRLKPTAAVRKRLIRLHSKSLQLTVRASLSDKAGNTGKATLKFRVAR